MYPCNLALNLKYERNRLLYKSCEKPDGSWRWGRGAQTDFQKKVQFTRWIKISKKMPQIFKTIHSSTSLQSCDLPMFDNFFTSLVILKCKTKKIFFDYFYYFQPIANIIEQQKGLAYSFRQQNFLENDNPNIRHIQTISIGTICMLLGFPRSNVLRRFSESH